MFRSIDRNNIGIVLSTSEIAAEIVGNFVGSNTLQGININTCTDTLIAGNQIDLNGSYGVYLAASCTNSTVTGNAIHNNGNVGIYIDADSDYCTVTNNTTHDNTNGWLNIANVNCANTHVTNNRCDEGAITNAGTNTRAWLNYDPSANVFIATINAPTDGGGDALP